ncbi:MAG: hypothetical protein ACSHX0_05125 [Akkermansiaceae bacterium]
MTHKASNEHRTLRGIITLLSVLLAIAIIYILTQIPTEQQAPTTTNYVTIQEGEHDTTLADLGTRPDWNTLDIWQDTITRDDFHALLTKIYTTGDHWKNYITIHHDHALIRTDTRTPDTTYRLNFSPIISEVSPSRNWSSAGELSPGTSDKPLAGIHIAIDPGHIGGQFAQIEERWFQIGYNPPVMEGELTLLTGEIIKKGLMELGAKVYLVRGKNQPVNPNRPESYRDAAEAKARSVNKENDEQYIASIQNKFFYRTGEIRERARRVNLAFNPDLVLCLHYNAAAWADPANPTLTKENHYHVLLHGALTSGEIAQDDQRYEMLVKILQRSHDEEKMIGKYIAHSLGLATQLPAYKYSPLSSRAIPIDAFPGLWARNLLANRLYQCPVIFPEPYLMNNQEVHDRIQLGLYEGTKMINGKAVKSIFYEYADAIVLALKEYYLDHRIIYQANAE